MANTFSVTSAGQNRQQLGGAFSEMFLAYGTITDQDAIADDVSVNLDLTIPGVQLGDMVLGISVNKDTGDANANVQLSANVTAANTVTLTITNVDETTDAYDADTMNGGTWRIFIGRPNWG